MQATDSESMLRNTIKKHKFSYLKINVLTYKWLLLLTYSPKVNQCPQILLSNAHIKILMETKN